MDDREELIRGLYAAMDQQDWPAATSVLDAEVTWIVANVDIIRGATLHGVEQLESWFGTTAQSLELRQTVRHVGQYGDTAVAIVDVQTTHDGYEARARVVDAFLFRDDRIVERVRTQTE